VKKIVEREPIPLLTRGGDRLKKSRSDFFQTGVVTGVGDLWSGALNNELSIKRIRTGDKQAESRALHEDKKVRTW
jgi:hypothetical protein